MVKLTFDIMDLINDEWVWIRLVKLYKRLPVLFCDIIKL